MEIIRGRASDEQGDYFHTEDCDSMLANVVMSEGRQIYDVTLGLLYPNLINEER